MGIQRANKAVYILSGDVPKQQFPNLPVLGANPTIANVPDGYIWKNSADGTLNVAVSGKRRHASFQSTTPGPYGYTFAGEYYDGDGGYPQSTDADMYDPGADSWDSIANCLTKNNASMACSLGSNIFQLGGQDDWTELKDTQIYQICTDTWSAGLDMTTGKHGSGTFALSNGVHCLGGNDSDNNLSEHERYENDTWTSKTNLPIADAYMGSDEIEGLGYILGGDDDNDTLEYDYGSDGFTTKTAINNPRQALGVFCLGTDAYCIGGYGPVSNVDLYDQSGDSWTAKGDFPTVIHGHAVMNINGVGFVCQGMNQNSIHSSNMMNDIWEYDQGGDSWATQTSPPFLRVDHPGVGV